MNNSPEQIQINFDAETGARDGMRRRDEAIDSVRKHARPLFIAQALEAIRLLAASGKPFTSDDVWPMINAETHDARALGAAFREAQRSAVIVPTPHYRPSVRPECHRNPKRVWIAAGVAADGVGQAAA